MCDLCVVWWAWFGSLLLGASRLVIALRLIMSGDVELNPGPIDQGGSVNNGCYRWLIDSRYFIEDQEILSKVDDITLGM
jgi:hypothetical protein